MSTVSFESPQVKETPVDDPKAAVAAPAGGDTPSQALVVRESQAPAVQQSPAKEYIDDGDFEGELGADDAAIPFLSLVHGVSSLSETFEPGQFVLGREVALGKKGQPFEVFVVQAAKRYKELLGNDNENTPRVFRTAVEVVENGGQTGTYGEDNGYFGPLGEFLFLVKKPAVVESAYDAFFPYDIGGELYALARYSTFKSAYTGVAKPIFSLKLQKLPITGTGWTIIAKYVKGENSYWKPAASQIIEANIPPGVKDFIAGLPR